MGLVSTMAAWGQFGSVKGKKILVPSVDQRSPIFRGRCLRFLLGSLWGINMLQKGDNNLVSLVR